MKRTLSTILISGSILISPGSPYNPYIITDKGTHYEIKSKIQEPLNSRNIWKPGTDTNPIIIEKDIFGNFNIHSQFPDFGNNYDFNFNNRSDDCD